MKKGLLTTVLCSLALLLSAQNYLPDSLKSKYHMLTWEELNNHRQGIRNSKDITPTEPPTGFVRNIAEWERNQGVIVAYPGGYFSGGFGIPIDLIEQLADITHVYIIYADSDDLSTIQDELTNGSVNTDNVSYHNVPADTYWTRDYSPWFIQHGNPPEAGIVNFDYNRNRPDDNNVPVAFGSLLGVDVFGMDLFHAGGNYMCDGMGKAASSQLVFMEMDSAYYSYSEQDVYDKMEAYLGIEDYMVIDDPMHDYIYHIDCWSKFLDVDKVLVGEVPESDSRYEDYEAAADYYENHQSSYGTNYEVYRAYSPDGQPYTNSLIMNGHVFVPVPTGSGSEWNDEAITVYEEAMPGYQIHAVENTSAQAWQPTDALHCRTHEVADVEMLHIFHYPLTGLQSPDVDYEISADIISYGGHNLISDSLKVYYSVNGENWQEVLMNHDAGNTYKASIPPRNPDDTVEYIIHAADASGRSENHPFIGFSDPHFFVIKEDSNIETRKTTVISCFPNPAKDNINIALHHFDNEKARLIISNVNGKTCREVQMENADDWTLLKIDVSDLSSGTYIIRVMGEESTETGKFIKF
ncbi:MAG: agmatine deiminase family protein [Candidatus Delongbacteria bacterium]|jgi:agmatine deiminase|nr:agmatine deiminase family protein [Candidatus Delongbacteria bacterium]